MSTLEEEEETCKISFHILNMLYSFSLNITDLWVGLMRPYGSLQDRY